MATELAPPIETRRIETAPGLVFDVSVAGPDDALLVLMLHGFCVSRYFWHNQMPALAEAGYFAVAPNQRGYSVDARSDPMDFDNYRVDRLIGDALDIVAASGHRERRFHLVGHDWGGSLAWLIADGWPERLASLTMLSRPHPASFARALAMPDGEQAYRSRHHREFLDPAAGPRLLADDAAWVRTRLARNGVPEAAIAAHLSVIGNPPAMEAALAWYRARGTPQPVGPTKLPTLFIWGEADDTVGRAAAEGIGEFIAADYQFTALSGVGHYAADQVPEQVIALFIGSSRPSPSLERSSGVALTGLVTSLELRIGAKTHVYCAERQRRILTVTGLASILAVHLGRRRRHGRPGGGRGHRRVHRRRLPIRRAAQRRPLR